jgi:aspartate beta-hydroxylase
MPLCIFSEPVAWLRRVVTSARRYRHHNQKPASFYAPHLAANPFGAPDRTSELLARNVERIRKEFESVARQEVESPSRKLVSAGKWNTYPLVRAARKIRENIDSCPFTWSIIEQCPLPTGVRGGVYFSILAPGTRIKPHCGPSNLKLRYHLTIHSAAGARIRSGTEWRSWEPDSCLILDDSFEHEVIHDGNDRRVVLIVDCWHADLTAQERSFLSELHELWRGAVEEAEPPAMTGARASVAAGATGVETSAARIA